MTIERFFYHVLVKAYPNDFRAEYEGLILQAYDDAMDDVREHSGKGFLGGYWGIFGRTMISVIQERRVYLTRKLYPLSVRYGIGLGLVVAIVALGPTGDIGNLWGPTGVAASVAEAQSQSAHIKHILDDPAYAGSRTAAEIMSEYHNGK
jgi:hypothetical protein